MAKQRGLTIHFMDGSKMKLDFPKQAASDAGAAVKLKEILSAGYIVADVDGVLITIPFANVKYLSLHPAPATLPEYVIKAATASEN
jgi:hypothetical protein